MSKKNTKRFIHCSACDSRQKFDGTCHICGVTDKIPSKPKISKKSRKGHQPHTQSKQK